MKSNNSKYIKVFYSKNIMENVVVETTVKSHYKTNREKNTNKTKRILYKSFRRGKI